MGLLHHRVPLIRSRRSPEEFNVGGRGIVCVSRPPLEALIRFDSPDTAPFPLEEGAILEHEFSRFYLEHPWEEAGTLELAIITGRVRAFPQLRRQPRVISISREWNTTSGMFGDQHPAILVENPIGPDHRLLKVRHVWFLCRNPPWKNYRVALHGGWHQGITLDGDQLFTERFAFTGNGLVHGQAGTTDYDVAGSYAPTALARFGAIVLPLSADEAFERAPDCELATPAQPRTVYFRPRDTWIRPGRQLLLVAELNPAGATRVCACYLECEEYRP